jgi:hypothetical protein
MPLRRRPDQRHRETRVSHRLQLLDLPEERDSLGPLRGGICSTPWPPGNTTEYIWGPRTIRTMHCKVCGCATHWEPLDPATDTRMGVNARNFEPPAVDGVRVRKFDGAETWAYVD